MSRVRKYENNFIKLTDTSVLHLIFVIKINSTSLNDFKYRTRTSSFSFLLCHTNYVL